MIGRALVISFFGVGASVPSCGTQSPAGSNRWTAPGSCQIAGYEPGSDVTPHASLDLDMQAYEAAIRVGDYTEAKRIYSDGDGNSMKSTGARTIRGFSTSAGAKMAAQALFQTYRSYWGRADYADAFVMAALDATALPHADVKARPELAKKGAAYQNVWMYVVHEMEDAIADCNRGNINDNDLGVHAWDEAWAFYTGSQQTAGQTDGYMIYNLAQKRCANFGTCEVGTGVAMSNKRILEHMTAGRDFLAAGRCSQAQALIAPIVAQMTVPLIQGTIRYAYKADLYKSDQRATKCAATVPELKANKGKEIAEGWAFAAAMLPQLHACSATAATMVRNNMDIMAATPVADTYSKVVHTLQVAYTCLGITCADVGGLLGAGSYFPGARPCDDGTLSTTEAYVAPSDACDTATSSGSLVPSPPSTDGDDSDNVMMLALIAALLGAVAIILGIIIFVFIRRKKQMGPADAVAGVVVGRPADDGPDKGSAV